ncbi:rod shape-determining protein [Actinomycetospora chiangmaiensis]|uniref:rod shape-determining protein n=1 Tax=Actinomycetospora chiangmaiensis TaxID=402650 RepID=UPI00036A78B0|nr:rod shape-determining protein [Actinomycetospora chiangmaiensis]
MGEIGIDLGTATTVVCHPRDGVLHDQPSVLLAGFGERRSGVLLGTEAAALVGRVPDRVRVGRPVQGGVVTDLALARTYLAALVRRAIPGPFAARRTRAAIGVPAGATPLERRALLEAAREAGLARVDLVPAGLAGATGAGVDVAEARVRAVADVGAGHAELLVLCRGEVLARRSCTRGGDEMTAAVRSHLREVHGLHVTTEVAERLKCCASSPDGEGLVAEGRDLATGRPRIAGVDAAEVARAIAPTRRALVAALADGLDDLPVAAVPDLLAEGVLLLGGGSLTTRLRDDLEETLGLPVKVPERPTTCVAEGLALLARRHGAVPAFPVGAGR